MAFRIARRTQSSPLIGVLGKSVSTAVSTYGTQFVNGTLELNPSMTIVLSKNVFTNGAYVLFDYSSSGGSFPGGQARLNQLQQDGRVDISSLNTIGVTDFQLVDDKVNRKVYLLLEGGFNVGTQHVEGDLSFGSGVVINLDRHLFNGPGSYPLFAVNGYINTASLQNVTVLPMNPGLVAGKLWATSPINSIVYVTLRELPR